MKRSDFAMDEDDSLIQDDTVKTSTPNKYYFSIFSTRLRKHLTFLSFAFIHENLRTWTFTKSQIRVKIRKKMIKFQNHTTFSGMLNKIRKWEASFQAVPCKEVIHERKETRCWHFPIWWGTKIPNNSKTSRKRVSWIALALEPNFSLKWKKICQAQ